MAQSSAMEPSSLQSPDPWLKHTPASLQPPEAKKEGQAKLVTRTALGSSSAVVVLLSEVVSVGAVPEEDPQRLLGKQALQDIASEHSPGIDPSSLQSPNEWLKHKFASLQPIPGQAALSTRTPLVSSGSCGLLQRLLGKQPSQKGLASRQRGSTMVPSSPQAPLVWSKHKAASPHESAGQAVPYTSIAEGSPPATTPQFS